VNELRLAIERAQENSRTRLGVAIARFVVFSFELQPVDGCFL